MSKLLFIFDKGNEDELASLNHEQAKILVARQFDSILRDNTDGCWRVCFGDTTDGDIYGMDNPDGIIHAATEWNVDIFRRAQDALAHYTESLQSAETLEEAMDTMDTFRLRMAVSAMDDHFSPAGEVFICYEETDTIRTVMDSRTLEFIKQNPNLCVLTTVCCH